MLGFPVLGVWPDGSDGSDINAAHRSNDGGLVLTADDSAASSSSTRRAPHAKYVTYVTDVIYVTYAPGE